MIIPAKTPTDHDIDENDQLEHKTDVSKISKTSNPKPEQPKPDNLSILQRLKKYVQPLSDIHTRVKIRRENWGLSHTGGPVTEQQKASVLTDPKHSDFVEQHAKFFTGTPYHLEEIHGRQVPPHLRRAAGELAHLRKYIQVLKAAKAAKEGRQKPPDLIKKVSDLYEQENTPGSATQTPINPLDVGTE